VSFEQLSLAASVHIVQNMREQDRECLSLLTDGLTNESFAVNRWQTPGAAWHLMQDGEPVCMGGIAQQVPWVGVAWMVTSERITPDSWKKLIRFSRKVFTNAHKDIQRIEAYVLGGWTQAERYAKSLGFTLESIKEGAARDGQAVKVYVLVNKNILGA
jgi:hypothetical protein